MSEVGLDRNERKRLYHKVLNIIEYNTLNKEQGPTVDHRYVFRLSNASQRDYDKMINLLKDQEKIFEIKKDGEHRLTLRDDPHLLAIIERETEKENPNTDFIGHINQMRA